MTRMPLQRNGYSVRVKSRSVLELCTCIAERMLEPRSAWRQSLERRYGNRRLVTFRWKLRELIAYRALDSAATFQPHQSGALLLRFAPGTQAASEYAAAHSSTTPQDVLLSVIQLNEQIGRRSNLGQRRRTVSSSRTNLQGPTGIIIFS